VDPPTEATKERDLGGFQGWVGPGIGTNPHVQAHGRSDPGELVDGDRRMTCSFDPADLRTGNART
jgi:hypothetical protein